MSQTVLVVAAEARELEGLKTRIGVRTLEWGLQFTAEGDLNGSKAILVADGPGGQLAGAATDAARRRFRPDAVVSTGFCGALDPALNVGDVFIATAVIDQESGGQYAAFEPEHRIPAAGAGVIVSVNRVASSAREKQKLRATGARAVEMEAAAVAARALIWDVPFYCIRSVSDGASEGWDIDFNRMRDEKGRFSRGRIVLSALAKPWPRIPSLVKLERGCRRAAESLGEFLANCRF
jgi:adenosylhomocysteine nucleosidase